MVVLWALLSILRVVISINRYPENFPDHEVLVYIIPLIFMAVLNIFLGITLFFPQKKNKMWLLSILVVTATLVSLNFFQTRLENKEEQARTNYKVLSEY